MSPPAGLEYLSRASPTCALRRSCSCCALVFDASLRTFEVRAGSSMRSPNIRKYASCAAELALGGSLSSVSLYVFRYMALSQTISRSLDGWPRYAGCVLYRKNIDNFASVYAFFRVGLAEDLPSPQK